MGVVNQGTVRIVIVVALIAVGAIALSRGFDPETTAAATPTESVSPSESPTEQPTDTGTPTPTDQPSEGPEPNTSGVLFMTLNGTSVAGLAAAAQEMLEEADYQSAKEADNSPVGGVETTTVYYRGGGDADQNRADAEYVAKEFFDGADVGKLDADLFTDDLVPPSAAIVIVVGDDYAAAIAA
jgi:hypothetical protein